MKGQERMNLIIYSININKEQMEEREGEKEGRKEGGKEGRKDG
jgi:hypothetical protein